MTLVKEVEANMHQPKDLLDQTEEGVVKKNPSSTLMTNYQIKII